MATPTDPTPEALSARLDDSLRRMLSQSRSPQDFRRTLSRVIRQAAEHGLQSAIAELEADVDSYGPIND